MKTVLSGRAATALVIDGDTWYRIDADRIEDTKPSGPHEWPLLFGACQDIQFLDVGSYAEVRDTLSTAVDLDHALSLALICLDAETRSSTRELAARDLETMLARTPEAVDFLWKVFSSRPLSSSAALESARIVTYGEAQRFFDRLYEKQAAISAVWKAWEALPERIFSSVTREQVFSFAVHGGIGAEYVDAVHQSTSLPAQWNFEAGDVAQTRNIRQVLSQWFASTRWEAMPEKPISGGLMTDETSVYPSTRSNVAVRYDEAFEKFYAYYPGVVALVHRLGFNLEEARDLAQEAYVRVLRSMDHYRGEAHWPYLQKIVRRVAANEIRAKHAAKRHGEIVSEGVLVTAADEDLSRPDEALEAKEALRRVRTAIAQLDTTDRTVLLLQLNGSSYEDMGQTLGISLAAVKSRLNMARKRLKEVLGEVH